MIGAERWEGVKRDGLVEKPIGGQVSRDDR